VLGFVLAPVVPWRCPGLSFLLVNDAALGVPVLAADALVGRGYVPLARAAAKYYRRTRHSCVAHAAEDGLASPDEILNWYGYWLVQHGIRLYGKQPPSQLLFRFRDGATTLCLPWLQAPVFTDLAVRWTDLIKHRRALLGKASS
jgi:hypothetical protein